MNSDMCPKCGNFEHSMGVPCRPPFRLATADTLPRVLTEADPEPAFKSVVLDKRGRSWHHYGSGWVCGERCLWWTYIVIEYGPVRLNLGRSER